MMINPIIVSVLKVWTEKIITSEFLSKNRFMMLLIPPTTLSKNMLQIAIARRNVKSRPLLK
jgi:hypothetical protein